MGQLQQRIVDLDLQVVGDCGLVLLRFAVLLLDELLQLCIRRGLDDQALNHFGLWDGLVRYVHRDIAEQHLLLFGFLWWCLRLMLGCLFLNLLGRPRRGAGTRA